MLVMIKRRARTSLICLCLMLMCLMITFAFLYAQINTSSVAPWKGRVVFQQKGCNQCHAVYGESGKGGPDLAKQKFYGTYLELAALMWNHAPAMNDILQKQNLKWQKLTGQDMANLYAYLGSLK